MIKRWIRRWLGVEPEKKPEEKKTVDYDTRRESAKKRIEMLNFMNYNGDEQEEITEDAINALVMGE